MDTLADEIRSCEYLYLDALTEPTVNEIRVVLVEVVVGPVISAHELALEVDPTLRSLLVGSRRIMCTPNCRRFELTWGSYIGYSVVNDSYSNGEPDTSLAVGGRGRFVEYSSSHYLAYLANASFASKEYPGSYRHWAIYCLDHTIDVASQNDPVIRKLDSKLTAAGANAKS